MIRQLLHWLFLLGAVPILAQTSTVMWYRQPARYFEESLVLGNGRMGASCFGGVETDSMFLNDATLWTGEPVMAHVNPDAHTFIPAIRAALAREDYRAADSLNRNIQGTFSQSYAPMGTFFLDFQHDKGEVDNYYRKLDLESAVSTVHYEINGTAYDREYFISAPDSVMVIRLRCSKAGGLSLAAGFKSQQRYSLEIADGTTMVRGYVAYHAEPNYRGQVPHAIQFDPNRGMRFATHFTVLASNGQIGEKNNQVILREGTEAIVLLSWASSFDGFNKNPATDGIDATALSARLLQKAAARSWADLLHAHEADYQRFFNRVTLHLGNTVAPPDLPTDERLARYTKGEEDKNLEILYFQFGRYLLISSSRTPGVPANLQGIWNPYMRPPWSSNYTLNINAEENYWPSEVLNLSEMHQPLLTFIGNIAQTGTTTARDFYGVQQGWCAAHNSDLWAISHPVGDFGKGDPVWACWNMGGAWLSTHLWEHFAFTSDTAWLRKEGYPLMKGSAEFCLDWLTSDATGQYLITSPGTSPENKYVTTKGYTGATLYGSTADLAIIRELFGQTIAAAKILEQDADFVARTETALQRLLPYRINSNGALQEWYHDWQDKDPQHRHQSHLFGLYPGHHITPTSTPELAEACRKTLEIKGDATTGWSKGWRINLWARLREGNRAYKMYRELLRLVPPDAVADKNKKGDGGTYPNLLDAHPPFQIDGNFGGSAAVAEMLLQSDGHQIYLLPALPDAWPAGSVKGLCARGGYVVDMNWSEGKVNTVRLLARTGGTIRLSDANSYLIEITLKAGEKTEIKW